MKTQRVPCKIGTQPAIMYVKGEIKVGAKIKLREENSGPWIEAIVDQVNPDGYFFRIIVKSEGIDNAVWRVCRFFC